MIEMFATNIIGPYRGKSRGRSLASSLLILLGAAAASAQPADTIRLRAADAVARALENGTEMARARAEVERARAGLLQSGGFFPSLPELEAERATDAPFQGEGEGDWEIRLSQEIELNGAYGLRREAAGLALERAELDLRAAEWAVRREARIAHVRAAAAEERLALIESLARFARRLDTIAGRQLDVGEISELDRNSIRIERGRTEIELVDARASLVDARAELARIAALPSGSVPVTGGIETAGVATIDSLRSLERAIAAGDESIVAGRPEMAALDRERERVEVERRIAARRALPNVRLGLGFRSETQVLNGEDIEGSDLVRSGFGRLRSTGQLLGLHLGVQLPLPIDGAYDIGRGELAAADAELVAIAAERRERTARIRSDLERAASRLRAAREALAIYDEAIAPLVARNLELLERGYTGGELTATQVVTQQEQLLRTAEAAIEARREMGEAEAELGK